MFENSARSFLSKLKFDTYIMILNIQNMTMSATLFLWGSMSKCDTSLISFNFHKKYCANSKKKVNVHYFEVDL